MIDPPSLFGTWRFCIAVPGASVTSMLGLFETMLVLLCHATWDGVVLDDLWLVKHHFHVDESVLRQKGSMKSTFGRSVQWEFKKKERKQGETFAIFINQRENFVTH